MIRRFVNSQFTVILVLLLLGGAFQLTASECNEDFYLGVSREEAEEEASKIQGMSIYGVFSNPEAYKENILSVTGQIAYLDNKYYLVAADSARDRYIKKSRIHLDAKQSEKCFLESANGTLVNVVGQFTMVLGHLVMKNPIYLRRLKE